MGEFEDPRSACRRIMRRAEEKHVRAQYDDLNRRIRAGIEAVNRMDPVDRALLHADQTQSFVRGMVGHAPTFDDPLSVLAAEVRRLRAVLRDDAPKKDAGGL
jgi:hypothetical protein